MKGAIAHDERTPNGFAVFKDSTAAGELRASVKTNGPWIVTLREQLTKDGALIKEGDFLLFTKDIEFSSPSAAAVIHGGNARGPLAWKDEEGRTLKEIEEKS